VFINKTRKLVSNNNNNTKETIKDRLSTHLLIRVIPTVILNIKHEISGKMSYDEIIDEFAAILKRKAHF